MRPALGLLVVCLAVPGGFAQMNSPSSFGSGPRNGIPAWKPAAQEQPLQEDLVPFATESVRLDYRNQHWLVVQPSGVLKDFGPSERAARQAMQVIHELGLNQRGQIGNNAFEYWLHNGEPPRRTPPGVATVGLDPSTLRVSALQGHWFLRNQARLLVNFGGSEADARKALQVMKKYRFDRVALIGSGEGAMAVFLAPVSEGTPGVARGSSIAPTRMQSPASPAQAKFSPWQGQQSQPEQAAMLQGLDQIPRPLMGQRQVRAPGGRIPLDWRQVSIVQVGGEWQLRLGQRPLVSFGGDSNLALLALQALRFYRVTEQHQVGEPVVFNFFTAPGTAPQTLPPGLRVEEFNPDALQVKQVDGVYTLCQDERVLMRLGHQESEAQHLLETIRKTRYDRVCRVGQPGQEKMTLLLRTR